MVYEKKSAQNLESKKRKKGVDAAKSVGRVKKVSYDLYPCEIFFAVLLKPFLNKIAFYTKLLG